MKQVTQIINEVKAGQFKELLKDIYVDESMIAYQEERYAKALESYVNLYGEQEVELYSAAGRSEVGGNHTDHQRGRVLAASINLDAVAIVNKNDDGAIRIVSAIKAGDTYKDMTIELNAFDMDLREEEKESSLALVRGVLKGLKNRGYEVGGFNAYITSDVFVGSGLSSSAAFEVIVGTILDGLYNDMKVSMVEIAQIGQYAENVYFGKPSGLLDQMACAIGGLITIDFKDNANPVVNKVDVDFEEKGYSLCIVDTKGSHDDLTDEYAAVPYEVKKVARFFGKDVLREVDEAEFMANIPALRAELGDRAILRAIHFFGDNARVADQVAALADGEFDKFLGMIKASGDSSYKYLQNVYTTKDVQAQNVSIALAVSEKVLGDNGVCRVHGGGFAGTIQAFVKNEFVPTYKAALDNVFGAGSCHVLKVRKYGGMKIM